MASDEEIVAQVTAGDRNAFRHLVVRHQRLVAHLVSRLIRDSADREEVCQDVFLRVYQGIGRFRFDAKLSTWIARIAYRMSLSHLERKRLPLYDDLGGPDRGHRDAAHHVPSAMEHVVAGEAREFVRRAIDMLPVQYRTAVTLYYLEEMSLEEVCTVMDLPAGTVKSHLFRARRLLKDELRARYSEEEIGT